MREALSDAYDRWLQSFLPDDHDSVALIAVGGLGRREPTAYSDLDLVLLHDGHTPGIAALADSIWYPIWDSGVSLDHSVRTPEQALDVAREDLKALLGLLDLRHIAGNAEMSAQLRGKIVGFWRASAPKRSDELRSLSTARWKLAGEGAFLLEPNLKDSRGGLRDVQSLRALALAQLIDLAAAVRTSGTQLLDIRGELHRLTGRADDVLRLQDHDGIATAFGLVADDGTPDRDEVLRRANHSCRVVSHALDVSWRRVEAGVDRRPKVRRMFGSPPRPVREGIARDVVAQNGEVVLARAAVPGTDAGLLLRAARAAASREMPLATHTLDRLAAECPPLPEPWPDEVRDDLVALLGTGHAAVSVLESLDSAGLLERLIPEWDAVRSRAQHNPVHRFTVDRHLLETAASATEHTREVARPDLLLVGALLHDIGKGYPGDHSVVGAEHAYEISRRMGFDDADTSAITAVVRHHLLLPDTATRRDLDDPKTMSAVAAALEGSAEVLELLHALAPADAAATGAAAWSDWKAGLVRKLVRRTMAVLQGAPLPKPERIDEQRLAMARAGRLDVRFLDDGEVIVAVPDSVGALYRTAGVLALHSLDVRSASIRTVESMAVNSFVVTPRFGRLPDATLVREDLARAMAGELGLAQRLRDKERTYGSPVSRAPTVTWIDDAATDATVCEIRAEDSIGLLCRLTAALERSGLDVRSALVSSLGRSIVDAFYVTTRDGSLVPSEARRDVEIELRKA